MADGADAARALLDRARDDETAARELLSIERVTDAVVGFHAQQAVEKALKAVLVARGVEYSYTHDDLAYLVELCEADGLELPEQLSEVDRLSAFAVRLRYDADVPPPVDRRPAVELAELAIGWGEREVVDADRD